MRKSRLFTVGLGLSLLPTVVIAQETTTYTYDAKGRVRTSVRSGGPSNNVTTTYDYDTADNRKNVTVVNSTNSSGIDIGSGATVKTTLVIVVPINGLSVMFINR
ncbi:YD repeat-containing protein [Sphingomonas sp. PP-F2F-G114-C0414]|nr:YD repeat-containing protein [Sphingomonas sp. PP-F2F-G114-C0414]